MSIEYLNLAFKAKIKKSSIKFLLVALADYANEIGEAYPSIATLEDKTSQNRKTLIAGLQSLAELGYISDTGQRRGRTKQVKVWQLHINSAKNGTVPETEQLDDDNNSPENGTVKESQNGDSTENGTVPNLPNNDAENGTPKASQKRYTEPSVFLTLSNPSDSDKREFLKSADPELVLKRTVLLKLNPDEVNPELWERYINLRKRKNAESTVVAIIAVHKALLTCVKHGVSMQDMLTTCLEQGWGSINCQWYLNLQPKTANEPKPLTGKAGSAAHRPATPITPAVSTLTKEQIQAQRQEVLKAAQQGVRV